MTKQLEVIQQKDAIKDSVTEAQKNDVDNFVKAFEADKKKGESKPEQIINIFDKTGKIILENMYANFKIKKEDKTIKRNDFNDPTVITFNTAILAFEKDLAEYNSKIKSGGNILSDDVAIVNKFKAELQVQSTATTNAEQDKQNTIDVLGKHYETQAEVSNGIFEGNYEGYTSMMTLLYNGSTSTDNNTKKIEGTTTDEKTFIELFNLYALGNRTGIKNGNNTINISDIKIGRGKDFTDARFNESNERVIQYQETKVEETPNTDGTIKKTETKETKHFVRGEDKDLQKVVADKSIPKTVDAEGKEHYDISQFSTVDRTSKEKGINAFDDQGNYEAFGRFLEAKGVEYTKANFSTITSQILDYKPTEGSVDQKDNKLNTLKNGYANELTDYVLKHTEMFEIYCTYLIPEKMDLFGADRETRVANFNKLADSSAFQAYVKTLPEEQQKKILDLRASIEENKPSSIKETLKTMGKMIASLMMMFGLGKGSLKKWLPQSMRKEIDDIYKKEFELKEAEKDAIGIITANLDKTKKREAVYDKEKELYTYKAPKAEIIKDENKITAANIGADYYQYIDPKILKKGIELYNNKHPNEKLTESDFIITKNKKEEPNISGITSKSAQFTEFMNLLIDDKGTWDVIAEANEKIATLGTKTLKDGTTQVYSEFFEKTEDRITSIIQTPKDVSTYLVSYLFAGSKNLSYTITENSLIGAKVSDVKETTTTKPDEYQATKDTKLYKDGAVATITEIKSGTELTATDKKELATGETLGIKDKDKDKVNFRQVKMTDGTIGRVEESTIKKVETTTTTPTLTFKDAATDFDKDSKLTTAGEKKKIHEVVDMTNPVEKIKITRKDGKTVVNCTLNKAYTDTEITTATATYVDDATKKRVYIYEGDKIEAVAVSTGPTEVAINTTWETIDTNLNDTKKSTEKINFEKTDYALDDKNTYQKEIIKLSELFTDKDNYKKLIADKITIEDIASVTNITHLKNMFTYRKLKSTNETENETFKLVKDFHYDKLTNIDPTKQTYEVTATEKDGIQITAKEGSTKKFTITIKNTDGKMSTGRKDETTV